jgi:hypothetical protein
VEARIKAAVAQSNTTLVQLFGVGPVLAATFLGEVGDIGGLGAQGVSLGTRFVVSDEAFIHSAYKQRIVQARASGQAKASRSAAFAAPQGSWSPGPGMPSGWRPPTSTATSSTRHCGPASPAAWSTTSNQRQRSSATWSAMPRQPWLAREASPSPLVALTGRRLTRGCLGSSFVHGLPPPLREGAHGTGGRLERVPQQPVL